MVEVVGTAPTSVMVITKFVYRRSWQANKNNIIDYCKQSTKFTFLKKKYYLYLSFISLFTLSIKWVMPILEGEINLNSLVLFNLEDTQYFPIIYSLSEFNFAPTYIDIIDSKKIIGFPLLGALTHSVFFKFIGIYAFIFLEYIFQIIFLIILFKVMLNIFEDYKKSFYFLIYLLLAYSLLGVLSIYQDSNIFKNLYHLFDNNFGTRYPRPLITGILIFLALYLILDFKKQLFKSFENTYVIKISIILGLLLNTFFYYFVIFSFLLSIIFLTNINKKIFSKILFKKLSLFVVVFLIFMIPFVFQNIYSEPDYSIRIGLIEISNEKRFFLVTYLLKKLLSLEFFPFLLVACLSFYYSNNYLRKHTEKLNTFFYLIISSILSTITFISLSPSIISIYHFADIILFSLALYFSLIFFTAIYKFIKKKNFSNIFFSDSAVIIFFVIFLMFDSLYTIKEFKKKGELIKEATKLEIFLADERLNDTNLKLFTNDRIASNLWLLNDNNNLLISDGFTNSLENSQIEYNYINNLKHFGFSEKKFKNFISFGKSEVRNNFFLRLFIYRYQANSLYTYSDKKQYTSDFHEVITNTSPFRAQNQIIPEDEKRRLLDLFTNHKVDSDLTADYIIINYSLISEYFEILNNDYTEIFSTKNYKVYSR
jgi:hypothetical protein